MKSGITDATYITTIERTLRIVTPDRNINQYINLRAGDRRPQNGRFVTVVAEVTPARAGQKILWTLVYRL
jgi:hypothetical protein